MKRVCTFILAMAMLLSLIPAVALFKTGAAEEPKAQAIKGTPTFDGDLSEWENCPGYPLTKRVVDGEAQTTGWIKLMWDENALYVGGQISDATNDGNDILKVLLDFDGRPAAGADLSFGTRSHAGVYSWMTWGYWFNDNNPKDPAPFNAINAYRGDSLPAGSDVLGDGETYNSCAPKYDNGIYSFELALIPTTEMKAHLQENGTIGFDFQWVDRNDAQSADDAKHTTIGWASDKMNWNDDLSTIGEVKLVLQPGPSEQTDYISCTDERLTYLGRWKEEDGVKISYWTTPSVTFDFTGSVLYLDLARKSSIAVELDGNITEYDAAEGLMKIQVAGEDKHTVRVYGPGMNLKGFYVAKDAAVTRTEAKPYYAMFIGDSISEDHRSGTFNSARLAGWDWTVYALGGISLCDEDGGYYNDKASGWGYYNFGYYDKEPMEGWDGETRIGMESAFFNYERPIDKISDYTPYDGFSEERQPTAIFIALGVNDYLQTKEQSENFVNDYAAFVQKLRGYYPDATIYIVQALNDNNTALRQSSIREAAKKICRADGNTVFLSETTQWAVEISDDNTHPSQAGYERITEKLKELLMAYAANGGPENAEVKSGAAEYGKVTVDGKLTEWGDSEKYPMIQRVVDGEAQTTGWYQIRWNEQGIFLAGQITDATEDANNDIIKILLDFDGHADKYSDFTERLHAGVYSWMMWGYSGPGSTPEKPLPFNPLNAYGATLPAGNHILGDGKTANQLQRNYENGVYTFEMNLVPNEELKAMLKAGAEIGFDIQWVDFNGAASENDSKHTTVGWASNERSWNDDLGKTGKIKLVKTVEPEPELVAIARNDTPKVDGKLDEWEDEQKYELTRRVIDGEAQTTGWFKLKWDADTIYVAGHIDDPTMDENNDILKFAFDFDGVPAGESEVRFYERDHAGAYSWMTWGYHGEPDDDKNPAPWNPLNAWCSNLSSGSDVIGDTKNENRYVWNYSDGAYDFEIALHPAEGMKQYLKIGSSIGFDIQWVDLNGATDPHDTKNTTIGWASDKIDWGDDLRKLGTLEFADGPRTQPDPDQPDPDQPDPDQPDPDQPDPDQPAYMNPKAEAIRETPTVDGDLSEWVGDTKYELTQRPVDGTATDTGWYMIRWSGDAIYVAGQITDATLDANNDIIKFILDFDGLATDSTYVNFSQRPNAGVHSWMTWGHNGGSATKPAAWNPKNTFGGKLAAGTVVLGDGINANAFEWRYADSAYCFEMALYPTAAMKEKLKVGTQLGFDIQWVDFNNASTPEDVKNTTIGWASPYADWGRDLRSLGTVTLLDGPGDTRLTSGGSSSGPGKQSYTNPTAEAAKGTPNVDGELREWATNTKYELTRRPVDGTAENTGWYKMKWDNNAIYIAGQIKDATEDANNDLVKVVFDFDGLVSSSELIDFSKRPNAGAFAWMTWGYCGGGSPVNPPAWNPKNTYGATTPAGAAILGDGVNANTFIWKYKDGCYDFEMALYPSSDLKEKLAEGTQIGFDIQWVDYNNASGPDDPKNTTIGWASPCDDWNTDLCSLGTVTLVGTPEISPLSATDGVGAVAEPTVTSTTITLAWEPTEGADSYLINVFAVTEEDGVKSHRYITSESAADTNTVIMNLDPNGSYAVQIIALDADGAQLAVYELCEVTTLLYDDAEDGTGIIKPVGEPSVPTQQKEEDSLPVWTVITIIGGGLVIALGALLLILRKLRKA